MLEFNLNLVPHIDNEGELKERAETIRATSVSLEMHIFLSAADASLLIKWLEEGFPPSAIMTAIDRVAQKRQQKRGRQRFTLKSCQRELKKLLKIQEKLTTPEPKHGFDAFIEDVKDMDITKELRDAKRDLIRKLQNLAENSMEREEQATSAINACRLFQERAWTSAQIEEESLLMAAEEELEPLRDMLGETIYRDALKEHMRNSSVALSIMHSLPCGQQ